MASRRRRGRIAIRDPLSRGRRRVGLTLRAAHRATNRVIAGRWTGTSRVGLAPTWTTYLNEYGLFMSPVEQGETWILPGSNVSYKRAALFDGDRARYPEFWKTFVNWEQEAGGSPLWLEPAMRVELYKPIAFPDFLRTRYHHGRCFAGMRVRDASWPVRIGRAGSTILGAPPSALAVDRGLLAEAPASRPVRGNPAGAAPAVPGVECGEAWGYLRGTGRACERTNY